MYRVKQFFGALTARVDERDEQALTAVLTPSQRALFRRMPTHDRQHSLNVCQSLLRAGYTEHTAEGRALLAAALLHDVGKSQGRIWLWQRVAIVLLARWAPGLLGWLARGRPTGWRGGFVVHHRHAQVGARLAEQAGCSPLTVALIRRHQEAGERDSSREGALLTALQRADATN